MRAHAGCGTIQRNTRHPEHHSDRKGGVPPPAVAKAESLDNVMVTVCRMAHSRATAMARIVPLSRWTDVVRHKCPWQPGDRMRHPPPRIGGHRMKGDVRASARTICKEVYHSRSRRVVYRMISTSRCRDRSCRNSQRYGLRLGTNLVLRETGQLPAGATTSA